MIPGDFIKPDFAVRNGADNAAGTLQYVITQVNPTPPASGSGIVFSIQFRGKVLGQQAELKIDSVQIADQRGVKLSVQPQNGTLTVVPPKPETPTPPAPTAPPESAVTDTLAAETAALSAAAATDTPAMATPTAETSPAATAAPAASTGGCPAIPCC